MSVSADTLRSVKTFPDLLRYLEDELDWPLQEYDFDELTFEYSPAELGLRDEDAVKIKAIHQLRPMVHGQPWGIFFVEFERKRMPVVVLRRILSHLVLKQRASANRARSAAWDMGDLLFISAFGDEASDQREIAFAHFHQEAGDLPTLRVLGWDGADTGLKLDYVANVLHERLCWPDDPANADAWREQWAHAFRHRLGHVIRTSDALAERLAALARRIRYAAITLMNHESDRGPLRQLHKAFQTALIHDLTEVDFADTYAQTITYGLLTAAISRTDMSAGREGTVLLAGDITEMVPITNPFLKEMLQTFLRAGGQQGGINFDELGIQDVVELLRGDETDLPAILRDFGNKTRGEDPVIHFYEHFLAAYDKQLKVQRGIFYTPQPVVSYIVRSVHELLQIEFGLEDGLASTVTWGEMAQRFPGLKIPEGTDPASPFVVILDPATGTATFLVEVIDVIFRTLTAKWQAQRLTEAQQRDAWNEYVPRHLLPRLHGYELMMAPYAIAHMKIGLKLFETGYRFGSDERVRVYLTNALEPASDGGQQLAFAGWAPALAHEAQAVDAIKRQQRFTVVIGNPPYSIISANSGKWIIGLCETYKVTVRLRERQLQALSDDYVKFMRLMQWHLERSSIGVLGIITNNGFLDGHLFSDLRLSLRGMFNRIYVLNLHGNLRTQERTLQGGKDDNVFDIQTGVAVSCCTVSGFSRGHRIEYSDLWGMREEKHAKLSTYSVSTVPWSTLSLTDRAEAWALGKGEARSEWDVMWDILRVFGSGDQRSDAQKRYAAGFVSQQDDFAIALSEHEIRARVALLLEPQMTEQYMRGQFRLCSTSQWSFSQARRELSSERLETLLTQCTYRPFDKRWTVFHRGIVSILRKEMMRHLFRCDNLALLATRGISRQQYAHIFVVNDIVDRHAIDNASESMFVFPLYIYPDAEVSTAALGLFEEEERTINLSPEFRDRLSKVLGVRNAPAAEDTFCYVYAIFHSPTYRARYAEFLKIDFPRVPFTSSLDLFRGLAALGGELVALHLMESPALAQHITTWAGPAAPVVEKVAYADDAVWIDKAQTASFRGVPEAVWNFHIGGYQVCEKWLKDRKGRTLSAEDIEHYQRVVVALHETIRIMGEIDAVIEEHGGWPIQ